MSPPLTMLERAEDRYPVVRRRVAQLTELLTLAGLDRDEARERVLATTQAEAEEPYRRVMAALRSAAGLDGVEIDLYERVALLTYAHAACGLDALPGVLSELRCAALDGEAALADLIAAQEQQLGEARDPRIAAGMLAVDRERQRAARTTPAPPVAATAAPVLVAPRSAPRARGAGRPRGASRRSSARSGDSGSGDDGPGSSDDDSSPSASAGRSPSLAPRPTQRDRVLDALRRARRGITAADFAGPTTIDGLAPISGSSLSRAVAELDAAGHLIRRRRVRVDHATVTVYALVREAGPPPRHPHHDEMAGGAR